MRETEREGRESETSGKAGVNRYFIRALQLNLLFLSRQIEKSFQDLDSPWLMSRPWKRTTISTREGESENESERERERKDTAFGSKFGTLGISYT